jgi:hypothetical protein
MANQYMIHYQNGLGNASAYQVSGFPQVNTGSSGATINYDNVTSQITISNHGSAVITASFDGSTAFTLAAGTVVTLNIKCRQVVITASDSWSVCTALTTINKDALPEP